MTLRLNSLTIISALPTDDTTEVLSVTIVPVAGEDVILVEVPELDTVVVDTLALVMVLGGLEESVSPPVEAAVTLEAVSASNLAILSSRTFLGTKPFF